ncbi:hypothetical protein HKX48_005900 [Thoreauomyces humboldtii]|nr:hypothetical protein HKX48_005900 [Thoreauomyces humboldtii]
MNMNMVSQPTLNVLQPSESNGTDISRSSASRAKQHPRKLKEKASHVAHRAEKSLLSRQGFANMALLLWMLAGVAIAIPVLIVLNHQNQNRERAPLVSDCESVVANIVSLMRRFAPYITNRAAFEAQYNQSIVQNSADGGLLPFYPPSEYKPVVRPNADSYFPTLFTPADSKWLAGSDLLSDPDTQQVVFEATHTGNLSIGPKLLLNLTTGLDAVHRFVLPWFGVNNNVNSIQGVFFGAIVVHELLDEVVAASTQNMSIGLQFLDTSAGNELIYSYPSSGATSGQTIGYYQFPVLNRQWTLRCYGITDHPPAPWVTFVFIILFAIAAALFTRYFILRRHGSSKKDVNVIENPRMSARQVDWMRTNAFSILNAIRDPLLIVDREGYVIDGNDDAMLLINYGVEDLIFGIHISRVFPGILNGKGKERTREKTSVKLSHPPGPWTSSCPLQDTTPSPSMSDNVVIDVESTYLDLPDGAIPVREDKSITSEDGTITPGMQEIFMRTKDNKELLVEANFSPFIKCQDQKERIQMVMFRDITVWKAAIKDSLDAKEAAESTRNEVCDYLSFVCHELRNPLHIIIGISTLLSQSLSALDTSSRSGFASPTSPNALSPLSSSVSITNAQVVHQEAIEHLQAVKDATRLMKTVINDTRMLSKVEAGTMEFDKSVFDLKSLCLRFYKSQCAYREKAWAWAESVDNLNNLSPSVNVGSPPTTTQKPVQTLAGTLHSSSNPDVEFKLVIKGLPDPSAVDLAEEEKVVGLGMTDVSADMPTKDWFPPLVKADVTRLTQVLTNIVTNAFEQTLKGCVTLRVIVENLRVHDGCASPKSGERRVRGSDSSGKLVRQALIRFEIEDTGRGIAKAEMPKLFKNYSQGSVDRALGSTGLSLNVTYALLNLMGSELQAFSTVGQGTTVWFSLWFELPDDLGLDDADSDSDIKGFTGSQLISDVLLGRRESVYHIGPKLDPKEKGRASPALSGSRTGSSTDLKQQHPPSPKPFTHTTTSQNQGHSHSHSHASSSSSEQRPTSTTEINLHIKRSPESLLGPLTSSAMQPGTTSPLSRSSSSTKPASISRGLSGDSPLSHLSRSNAAPTNLRRSSQGEQRKPMAVKAPRKGANPAARRLGTHPLKERPIRVLVVEDNEVLLKIAGTTLARAGFEVQQAVNGEQAIQRVADSGEKYFDVVLMDLLMPVMDGFQATEEIRRRGWTMPVIALTAKTLESDRLRCFKIGFNYFMTKPFQLGDIATVIRFMVGAEAEQKAQAGLDGTSATNQPTYGGPWSKFT